MGSKNSIFTSEFSGYIYDSKTKLPLKNKVGYIGVDGAASDPDTKLNENSINLFYERSVASQEDVAGLLFISGITQDSLQLT